MICITAEDGLAIALWQTERKNPDPVNITVVEELPPNLAEEREILV